MRFLDFIILISALIVNQKNISKIFFYLSGDFMAIQCLGL